MSEPGTERPLRVLFVNRMACLERGGGETFDLEISRFLESAGVEVRFLSGAPLLRAPPMPKPGAVVLHTPWLRWFPWDRIRGGWRVRQWEFEWFERRAAHWIRRHAADFDIIQICELPNLVHWLKRSGVRTPVVMRLTAPNYYDPRGGVAQADALMASGSSIEKLRERGHADVVDIPNAVDADLFRPHVSDFRKKHGIGEDEFVSVYAARFQDFKNHPLLLNAFAKLLEQVPESRLALAGSGPLQEAAMRQAAELKISERVLFLGEVPHRELPGVLAAANLKVISSDYESFCFAAIEAMSTALPVLTTDCAWVPRLVADGAGLIVPVGDPDVFAESWIRLARHPALCHQLGAEGRRRVLKRHTWPLSAQLLLDLYRSILKGLCEGRIC